MKSIFSLMTWVICLELLIAPIVPQLRFLNISNALAAESCPTGFQFDSTLGRCLTTQQTAEVMNAVSQCSGGDASCYKANAESALKKAEEEGKIKEQLKNKGGALKSVMTGAAVAVPLLIGVTMLRSAKKAGVPCKSFSLYAMMGGGVALFAGEVISNMQHKKRLKKIKADWDKIVKPDAAAVTNKDTQRVNATEAQSQAFEMLARSEDSLASAAKLKTMTYGVATAAFAAATVMTTLEAINLAKAKALSLKPGPDQPAHQANYARLQAQYTCSANPTPETGESAVGQLGAAEGASTAVESAAPAAAGGSVTTPRIGPPERWESLIEGNLTKVHLNNFIHAKDFASILVLNQELNFATRMSPSLEEYEQYSSYLKTTGVDDDKSILELVKQTSMGIYNELIPVKSAAALDPTQAAGPAAGLVTNATGTDVASKVANTGKAQGMGKLLKTPMTRAIIGGIFTAWSAVMLMHAMKQAKISKARAKFLRDMKDDFNVASGAINSCTEADRSSPGKPECYCYTPEGQRNPSRTSSTICQSLFTGKSTTAGNYLTSADSQINGCVSNSGTPDSSCTCKKNNTCISALVGTISGINPGTFSMLSSSLSPVGKLGNGSIDSGSVSGEAAVNNALRLLDTNKKLEKTAGLEQFNADKLKNTGPIEGALIAAAGGASPSSMTGSNASMGSLSPSSAAAELEKELEKASDSNINTASGGESTAPIGGGSGEEQLDFGLAAEQGQADQIAEVMGQDLNYGQSDINTGSTTNIFEVLSNRYQRSGMRRLFDEEGKTKADKAAETDVNK